MCVKSSFMTKQDIGPSQHPAGFTGFGSGQELPHMLLKAGQLRQTSGTAGQLGFDFGVMCQEPNAPGFNYFQHEHFLTE